jgi:hypothetical protein
MKMVFLFSLPVVRARFTLFLYRQVQGIVAGMSALARSNLFHLPSSLSLRGSESMLDEFTGLIDSASWIHDPIDAGLSADKPPKLPRPTWTYLTCMYKAKLGRQKVCEL